MQRVRFLATELACPVTVKVCARVRRRSIGIGTTLAIIGAYVLAGELSRAPSLEYALRRYEEVMRPVVEQGQDVPKIAPKMLQPKTRLAVALQHAFLRVAAAPGIKQIVMKSLMPKADEIALPHYDGQTSKKLSWEEDRA